MRNGSLISVGCLLCLCTDNQVSLSSGHFFLLHSLLERGPNDRMGYFSCVVEQVPAKIQQTRRDLPWWFKYVVSYHPHNSSAA